MLLDVKGRERLARDTYSNVNLQVEGVGIVNPGADHSIRCTIPASQEINSCEFIHPKGDSLLVDSSTGSVLNETSGSQTVDYQGDFNGDSVHVCGIRILSVQNKDFGDWVCRVNRIGGPSSILNGHANIRTEGYVSDLRPPRDVLPHHYDLSIVPRLPEKLINGEFNIIAACSTEFVDTIYLHILELDIDEFSIKLKKSGIGATILEHGFDFERELYIITFLPLPGNSIEISGSYTGNLIGNTIGLFFESFTDSNSDVHDLAVTQLEATWARKVFPCFDEPDVKATFDIKLAHLATHTAIANMPGIQFNEPIPEYPGYYYDTFATTVTMSTYLVALAVSDMASVQCPILSNGIPLNIWARPEAVAANWTAWPQSYSAQELQFYENFFNIAYPLPKMDFFVHDRSGAMENWGLDTYGERFILFDPINGGPADLELATSVVTHELAHQWFGNLVTMEWWSELWLNEGFATFVSYYGAEYVTPGMRHWDRFTVDETHGAMELDSMVDSHPINAEIYHPIEIEEAFDAISYDKGGTILRMMTFFLTFDTFQAAVTNYLLRNQFANAIQDDLWEEMTIQGHLDGTLDADKDIKTMMDTWTNQKNYPVLTVTRTGANTVDVAQSRFLVETDNSGDNHTYTWWIPLTFTAADGGDYDDVSTKLFLAANEASKSVSLTGVPDNAAYIFNIQQMAFMRVNYDAQNWEDLATALLRNHLAVHVLNRVSLLDDVFHLVYGQHTQYEVALNMTQYLFNELDQMPWTSVDVHFRRLRDRFLYTAGFSDAASYIDQISSTIAQYLTLDESDSFTFTENLNRLDVLPMSCDYDASYCITESANKISTWMSDTANNPFGIRMRDAFYCAGVKGSPTNVGWQFMKDTYELNLQDNMDDRQAIVRAITCPYDQTVQQTVLGSLLSSGTNYYDDIDSFIRNIAANPVGRTLVWSWVQTNWNVNEMVPVRDSVTTSLINEYSTYACEQSDVDLINAFIASFGGDLSAETNRALNDGIDRIQDNIAWKSSYYDGIIAWFQSWPGVA